MSTEHFDQFKKTYKDIQPPEYLVQKGWADLALRLPEQEKPRMPIFKYSFVFAALLLCLTGGTIMAAQTAQPGETLYSVKEASQKVLQPFDNPAGETVNVKKIIPSKPKAAPSPTMTLTPTPTEKMKVKKIPTVEKQNNSFHNKALPDNPVNKNGKAEERQQDVAGTKTENPSEKKEQKEKPNPQTENRGNGNNKKN